MSITRPIQDDDTRSFSSDFTIDLAQKPNLGGFGFPLQRMLRFDGPLKYAEDEYDEEEDAESSSGSERSGWEHAFAGDALDFQTPKAKPQVRTPLAPWVVIFSTSNSNPPELFPSSFSYSWETPSHLFCLTTQRMRKANLSISREWNLRRPKSRWRYISTPTHCAMTHGITPSRPKLSKTAATRSWSKGY
jgi:hypothetical protein